MDLIYRRVEGGETREGYLSRYDADFDITTNENSPTNDFEIKMDIPKTDYDLLWKENEISCIVYVDGTEWGGIISGADIDVGSGTITYTGWTWRGLLSLYVIEPPSGQDYRVVTSNTNLANALRVLPMHPMIDIQNTSYKASKKYQYERYITVHEGVTGLLKDNDQNLRLKFAYDESTGKVKLRIATTTDRTNLIEVSQDYDDKVKLSISRDGNTPKRLICLGSGELRDREILNLYADENWNISTTEVSGAYPVNTYDYSGSKDLSADGRKHFQELIDQHMKIGVDVSGIDLNLGDVIAARDRLSGEYVTAEITNIIWKCNNFGTYQTESFEYKTAIKSYGDAVKKRTYSKSGTSAQNYDISNVVSYYRTPVTTMANTINGLTDDWDSFVYITDPHGSANKQHSQDIALYLLDNTPASMIVLGGDYCASEWDASEFDTYVLPFLHSGLEDNIYAVFGNHETFAGGTAEAKQSIYHDFLAGKSWLSGSLANNYYYFDDTKSKIRYMFLNTSDGGSQYVMSQTQINWITQNVRLPDSSWQLLVIGHVNLDTFGITSTTMTGSTESNASDIISAIKHCNGTIIGYLCGHQHIDASRKVDGIQHTTILCDRFENTDYYSGYSVTNRTAGTTSEQAVSVVSINRTNKQVVIRRIGAGRNSTISYSY